MAIGTSTVSFGSTPTSEATVVVTGQTTIASGAYIEAFMAQDDTTVDNNATDHSFAAVSFRLAAGSLVVGTGFTVFVTTIAGEATGDFKIRWVWTNP